MTLPKSESSCDVQLVAQSSSSTTSDTSARTLSQSLSEERITATGTATVTSSPGGRKLSAIPSLSSPFGAAGMLTSVGTATAAAAPGGVLPWDRFSYWLNAILVVTFDIEMGQSLELIYPSTIKSKLSASDKANICYMAFPDSNSGFLGDTQYHFRLKLDAASSGLTSPPHHHNHTHLSHQPSSPLTKSLSNSNSSSSPSSLTHLSYDEYNRRTLAGLEVDKSHMFGYVFFRQVKDKSLKRGYFQKSIVLLSKFPLFSLFNYVLSVIAVEYFAMGGEVLDTACHDIDKWPLPVPGQLLALPILGNLIEICLPVKIDKFTLPVVYKKELPTVPFNLPCVHEFNLYKCLHPLLVHIHLLWELVLVNEPIVVIASVPNKCSELVQALISIIWPLKYASDYRPFFTIHNTEFAEYSSKSHATPSVIIGCTNPFFTKCFEHWPNIIKLADSASLAASGSSSSSLAGMAGANKTRKFAASRDSVVSMSQLSIGGGESTTPTGTAAAAQNGLAVPPPAPPPLASSGRSSNMLAASLHLSLSTTSLNSCSSMSSVHGGGGLSPAGTPTGNNAPSPMAIGSLAVVKTAKLHKTSNIKVVDSKPAIYTSYESFLGKDKAVLLNLSRGAETNRPQEAQTAILRRYFYELTQHFMIPLERYFASLMPLQKSVSPFKSVPRLRLFDANEFVRTLKQSTTSVADVLPASLTKGDLTGLYKRFFDTLNFKRWLAAKKTEADTKLELLHLQAVCDCDINEWLKGKLEIEIIDQYMNVKRKQELIDSHRLEADESLRLKLAALIGKLLNALPDDTRSILLKK